MKLLGAHSISLRKFRSLEFNKLAKQDSFDYECSFCKSKHKLGITDGVYVTIEYQFEDEQAVVVLCGRCIDILVDALFWGKSPIMLGSNWMVRSKFNRVSVLEKQMYCASCSGSSTSFLVLRHDRLQSPVKRARNIYSRFCARCVIAYLKSMESEKKMMKVKRIYVAV